MIGIDAQRVMIGQLIAGDRLDILQHVSMIEIDAQRVMINSPVHLLLETVLTYSNMFLC